MGTVLGFIFFGSLLGGGGPDPFSSPLFTNTRSGRPRHLIEDKYFLAFEPALSSNSLGVNHSSPNWMHLPLLPDSYLDVNMTAVVDLHLTFITGPIRGTIDEAAEEVGVLVLLPLLSESFMPFIDF